MSRVRQVLEALAFGVIKNENEIALCKVYKKFVITLTYQSIKLRSEVSDRIPVISVRVVLSVSMLG
jgi:hypothetical protein